MRTRGSLDGAVVIYIAWGPQILEVVLLVEKLVGNWHKAFHQTRKQLSLGAWENWVHATYLPFPAILRIGMLGVAVPHARKG